jgi:orotate phosphoribosyltransferase
MRGKATAELLLDNSCYLTTTGDSSIQFPNGEKTSAYLSCRLLLSKPKQRKIIEDSLAEIVARNFDKEDVSIVGLATAGIAWAHSVAKDLRLPMLYVRSEQKQYGVGGLIEGGYEGAPEQAIIVDDAIGTGATVNRAIKHLDQVGIRTIGFAGIALMGEDIKNYLESKDISVETLTDFECILAAAHDKNILQPDEIVFMRELYKRQEVVDE